MPLGETYGSTASRGHILEVIYPAPLQRGNGLAGEGEVGGGDEGGVQYRDLVERNTWTLVDPVQGVRPMGAKWVYTTKQGANRSPYDALKQSLITAFKEHILGCLPSLTLDVPSCFVHTLLRLLYRIPSLAHMRVTRPGLCILPTVDARVRFRKVTRYKARLAHWRSCTLTPVR